MTSKLVWCTVFQCLKGPEEQFSLFGEVFPDTLRVSFCQDEESATRRVARKVHDSPIPMEMDQLFDMDVLMSEFSDTLFSTLASHQPVACPNERDIGEQLCFRDQLLCYWIYLFNLAILIQVQPEYSCFNTYTSIANASDTT